MRQEQLDRIENFVRADAPRQWRANVLQFLGFVPAILAGLSCCRLSGGAPRLPNGELHCSPGQRPGLL